MMNFVFHTESYSEKICVDVDLISKSNYSDLWIITTNCTFYRIWVLNIAL